MIRALFDKYKQVMGKGKTELSKPALYAAAVDAMEENLPLDPSRAE
jgi:hypothetical protein